MSTSTLPATPTGLAQSQQRNGAAPVADAPAFWPSPPQTIEESGLMLPTVEDHLVRLLYFGLQMTGAELAAGSGLPYIAIQPLVHGLTRDQVFERVGQKSVIDSGYVYALAPKGRVRADEALQRTWYHGPLPVPLAQYVAAARAQTIGEVVVRRDNLRAAFADLVIGEELLDRIGPAVNAADSIFMYGAPGNGKTAIAERITRMIGGAIFVPHAIEVDGSIIMVYDDLNHRPTDEQTTRRYDTRWTRVRRPVVVAGGELTLASLDLTWNGVAKFYEAPLQMKANGGTFLIDDFGRQMVRPVELLNRWIVPLERRIDYLTLQTGKRLEVPFDQLLIFSTNLNPADLADEAFQRRVRFRVAVDDPTEAQFAQVFKVVCAAKRVPFDPAGFEWLLRTWWQPYNRPLRMVQPRDLVNQLIAQAKYLGRPPAMEPDLLDRACRSYFVLDPTPASTAARFT
ncbi:MAG: ATP-binding protein [Chloroflexi bacterium]|nr:ATP-binding protein [Chloroflexota bacterium]